MTSPHDNTSSLQQFAVGLFNGAASGYDRIAQTLSYGQYRRWQRVLIDAARLHNIDQHATVLDVATGTGGVALQLSAESGCHVIGLDQSAGMLSSAARRLRVNPSEIAERIDLVEGTAGALPFADNAYDAVTFTYLFRYVDDPAVTMRELVRVARPGAFVGFIEFHVPPLPWKPLWMLHTRLLLPVAGRLISDGWYEVGKFLGPSIERFYARWDVTALEAMMQAAGLRDVQHRVMSLGGGLVMWGRKDDAR